MNEWFTKHLKTLVLAIPPQINFNNEQFYQHPWQRKTLTVKRERKKITEKYTIRYIHAMQNKWEERQLVMWWGTCSRWKTVSEITINKAEFLVEIPQRDEERKKKKGERKKFSETKA